MKTFSWTIRLCGAGTEGPRWKRLVGALGAATVAGGLLGQPARAQIARYEYIAIPSTTIANTDFLNGKKDGPAVMLAGLLRLPAGTTGRVPAIVMLHGSGGPGGTGSQAEGWSAFFNSMGIATFAVDSFSGRGLVSTVTDQGSFSRGSMINDAYRALDVLGKHRLIDPGRIAIMGFSLGAQAAVYSSLKRFQKSHGPASGNLEFAAYVGMYTPCNTVYRDIENVADKPIRLLHGTADNYVIIGPCSTFVERLTKAGKNIRLTEYEGAEHTFDAPGIDPVANAKSRVVVDGQTTRKCTLVEDDAGQITNADTRQVFTFNDACVEKNATVAYNEVAAKAARSELRDFFVQVFGLKP